MGPDTAEQQRQVKDDSAELRAEHERYISADVDPHHGLQLVRHGYTVLVTEADGTITGEGPQGFYDYDTRVLSRYQILVDGRPPRCDSVGLLDPSCWIARLTVDR